MALTLFPLKSLSVSIYGLALPEQYSNLGRSVNDVFEELYTAFRKFGSKKTGNKPKKTCQTLAKAFSSSFYVGIQPQ